MSRLDVTICEFALTCLEFIAGGYLSIRSGQLLDIKAGASHPGTAAELAERGAP